ncbi:MAG: hypothetical protein KBF26_02345 [Opitutaceae bacterium]|nr:hypothetical protein [Opitutaceae bacterium]
MLCALPSAYWALMVGFKEPAELCAMAAGIALCVVLFAGFSASDAMRATAGRKKFVRALKMSAWIKCALLLGVGLAWVSAAWIKTEMVAWFVIGLAPDLWAGFGSLSFVGWLSGMKAGPELGQLNSFGWTLLTALVQGALISGLLVIMALVVLGYWRLLIRFKRDASVASA